MFTQVVTIHIASLVNGTHQYLFGNFSSFLVEFFSGQLILFAKTCKEKAKNQNRTDN